MIWSYDFIDLLLKEGYITEDESICLRNNNDIVVDNRRLCITQDLNNNYYLYVDDDFCIMYDTKRNKWKAYDI